jgi:hypothetical protein
MLNINHLSIFFFSLFNNKARLMHILLFIFIRYACALSVLYFYLFIYIYLIFNALCVKNNVL